MKRMLCAVVATVLFVSSFAMCASAADNAKMLNPKPGDLTFVNPKLDFIVETKNDDGIITGRRIDASAITEKTTIANDNNNTLKYRNYAKNGETYAFSGASARFKNNFVWEFDFCFDKFPQIAGGNGILVFHFGSNWKNEVRFCSFDTGSDSKVGRLQWGANAGNDVMMSAPTGSNDITYPYMLEEGKTYHLKLEFDFANNGKLYATFTNPYLVMNDDGTIKQKLDQPAAEGVKVYTKSTASSAELGTPDESLAGLTDGAQRLGFYMQAFSAFDMDMTNEKFTIDCLAAGKPEFDAWDDTIDVSIPVVNITGMNYYMNYPVGILAVYDEDGKLVKSSVSKKTLNKKINALEETPIYAAVDGLEDGTYTAKAFLWTSLEKMKSYRNCPAETTFTVEDGEVTID